MVETSDVKDTSSMLKDTGHKLAVGVESLSVRASGATIKGIAKSKEFWADTYLVGAAVSAGVTQWDYVKERDDLRKTYELEIAAQTGKPYNQVTNKDLDRLGKQNAVIGDALKRARWKRNLGLAVGAVAVGVGLAIGLVALPAVTAGLAALLPNVTIPLGFGAIVGAFTAGNAIGGALGLVQAVAVALPSVLGFSVTEEAISHFAEKKFGMKEPSIGKVTRSPDLQDKLSISSQVAYLQHLQKRINHKKPKTLIREEQVLTAILAAQPDMANDIRNRYGAKFSALAPEQQKAVLADVSQSINVAQITADLNHRQIRAQEMAFIMQGESSGVPKRETPRMQQLEQEHRGLRRELDVAKTEIHNLKTRMMATDTKLCKIQRPGQDIARKDAPAIGPAQQRILDQRAAAAAQGTARA